MVFLQLELKFSVKVWNVIEGKAFALIVSVIRDSGVIEARDEHQKTESEENPNLIVGFTCDHKSGPNERR